jgi:ornithine--oxo-acid transaminase
MDLLLSIDTKYIKEIRGRGLWVGIELKREAGGARRFCEALMEEGLLCKETHEHVIRLAPPLIITKEEINWAFSKIEKVLVNL